MKTTSTFGIVFWADSSRIKNGHAPLYVRITVNGKRVTISLKRRVNLADWDGPKARLKGTNQQARILNNYLDEVQSELFLCYQSLRGSKKFVTAQCIKKKYCGNSDDAKTLSDIINYHNVDMEGKLKWGTQKNYFTTLKYISGFLLKYYGAKDMYLQELDYDFILKFEKFLRAHRPVDHQRPMENNTVMKHISRLRKLVNLACKLGWIAQDPFGNFSGKYIKNEREFLSLKELQAIESREFHIERLQLVKDLFIFGCYTSLSYIDVVQLTPDNIGHGIDGELWVSYRREKTSKPIQIPLLPKALEILEKYKGSKKSAVYGTIFPKISNQKLNSYLKEIADVCGVKRNLTFHIARHTFATTVTLSNGMPIETVSKLLGHSKISTTQIYAKVIERKVSDDMQRLRVRFSDMKQ